MKTLQVIILLLCWAESGKAQEGQYPEVTGLKEITDRSGNKYIAGTFRHVSTIAGRTFYSADSTAGFMVKLDKHGHVKWHRTFEASYLTIGDIWVKGDHVMMIGEFRNILRQGIFGLSDTGGAGDYIIAWDKNGHTELFRAFRTEPPEAGQKE